MYFYLECTRYQINGSSETYFLRLSDLKVGYIYKIFVILYVVEEIGRENVTKVYS